jgi:Spy/CpxP family protein refolding chaperone
LTAEQKKQVADDLKRFFGDLNLSESQKQQLRPILTDQRGQIQAVRNDSSLSPVEKSTKIASIRAGDRSKIATVLSADQMSKWDAAVVKARAEAKKRRSE